MSILDSPVDYEVTLGKMCLISDADTSPTISEFSSLFHSIFQRKWGPDLVVEVIGIVMCELDPESEKDRVIVASMVSAYETLPEGRLDLKGELTSGVPTNGEKPIPPSEWDVTWNAYKFL